MIMDIIRRTDGHVTSEEIEQELAARSLVGKEAYRKGRTNEARVAQHLEEHPYIKRVYLVPAKSTWDKRDRRGIDIVADLEDMHPGWRSFENRVYAQVKSSQAGIEEFKKVAWEKMMDTHFDWLLWISRLLGIEGDFARLDETEVELILKCYFAEKRLMIILHGEKEKVHECFVRELNWINSYHAWKNNEIGVRDLLATI